MVEAARSMVFGEMQWEIDRLEEIVVRFLSISSPPSRRGSQQTLTLAREEKGRKGREGIIPVGSVASTFVCQIKLKKEKKKEIEIVRAPRAQRNKSGNTPWQLSIR
ncbi:hypothetical protein BS78_04G330900 [Paspalum vaginatum]|nr:hypothetical protein BS78_04G330900 [Paspalum vaginatum]